jgi:iron complex outermembrane receptor protein
LNNKLTSGYDYIYYTEKRRINAPGSLEDIIGANDASQGVYLLDELTVDERWLVNAGVRGAWAGYVFNQTQQTPVKFDRSDTTEGYDGGLGYKYNPDSKVFVDYTRSYRLPNLDEFFLIPYPGPYGLDSPTTINPSLTYQVGNQYQLGVKDQSFKNVNLGFTATAVQYKNEIYDDAINYFAPYYNANYNGRTRHYSEEADASVELFNRKLEPFANITFQQTEFIGGQYSGSQIPDVPDQLAHAGITYRPLNGLSTTVSTDFVGKRFGIGDDTNIYPKVKRYDTVNWEAKYDFKNIELWINLNNIFNAQYFVYGSTYGIPGGAPEVYYPAPGRNVEAGVKVKF